GDAGPGEQFVEPELPRQRRPRTGDRDLEHEDDRHEGRHEQHLARRRPAVRWPGAVAVHALALRGLPQPGKFRRRSQNRRETGRPGPGRLRSPVRWFERIPPTVSAVSPDGAPPSVGVTGPALLPSHIGTANPSSTPVLPTRSPCDDATAIDSTRVSTLRS